MPNDFEQLIDEVDNLIRAGRANHARRLLQTLKGKSIPSNLRLSFANLARRSEMPDFSIRILNPVVRPEGKIATVPTEAEKAEYAAGLIKLGAVAEAISILEKVDTGQEPQALLFMAFALIAQWDYEKSLKYLQLYVSHPKVKGYSQLVGRVNLAGALAHLDHRPELMPLLDVLERETERDHPMLHANVLRFRTQTLVEQNAFRDARTALKRVTEVTKNFGGPDELFSRKWDAIIEVLERGGTAQSTERLDEVRALAQIHGQWETIRDCDYYQAMTQKDKVLLAHLYYGTPYESFRARIREHLGAGFRFDDEYIWNIYPGKSNDEILDFFSGKKVGKEELKVGQILYRAIAVLVSDFYRPFRIATLHSMLYPNDYYHPVSSPARIHRAIQRLRDWFSKAKIPLEIHEAKQNYRLMALRACSIRIPSLRARPSRIDLFIETLLNENKTLVTATQAAALTKMSHNSALWMLRQGIKQGLITRSGKGKATEYQVVRTGPAKKAS